MRRCAYFHVIKIHIINNYHHYHNFDSKMCTTHDNIWWARKITQQFCFFLCFVRWWLDLSQGSVILRCSWIILNILVEIGTFCLWTPIKSLYRIKQWSFLYFIGTEKEKNTIKTLIITIIIIVIINKDIFVHCFNSRSSNHFYPLSISQKKEKWKYITLLSFIRSYLLSLLPCWLCLSGDDDCCCCKLQWKVNTLLFTSMRSI